MKTTPGRRLHHPSGSWFQPNPWTRARRWTILLMLVLLIATLMFIFLGSMGAGVSWPLTFRMRSESEEQTSVSSEKYFVAYPGRYHFFLDEPNRCRRESPFVVLVIPVAPRNRAARDAIRNTWGRERSVLGHEVGLYFLLGQSELDDDLEVLKEGVLQESRRHHDILQSDFVDSYMNLTIKTMVMFEWLSSRCPNASYAMKIDSDIFLNVHNLVRMLIKAPPRLYLTGNVVRGAYVLRDHQSKWFLPWSAFPESRFPPYVLGLGYVFSMDLPAKILGASAHVRAVYIEDVYVGLCMRHLGIDPTDPPSTGLFRAAVPYYKRCYWTRIIATLLQDSKELWDVWKTYLGQIRSGC